MAKAKLTEEQKQANKRLLAERRQAYNARRKVYDADMTAAKETAERLPEYAAHQDASTAFRKALRQRDEAIRSVDAEIEKLIAHREALQLQHRRDLEEAKTSKHAAWTAHGTTLRKLQQEVKDRYPDMADCWNLHDWIQRTNSIGPPEAQLEDFGSLESHSSIIDNSH